MVVRTPDFDRFVSLASGPKEAADATSGTGSQPEEKVNHENAMKPDIHPKYVVAPVHCACGASWTTRSTKSEIRVEICSTCHPFFTGKQRLVDSAGRIERFTKKFAKRASAGA